MATAAVAGFLVLDQTAKACRKHLVAVLELKAAQMLPFAVWVLTLAQKQELMAARTLMPADQVLMVDRMLNSDQVPMVVRRLESVEQVPRADQMLAVVADLSQRIAQRHYFVVDRELTVGRMLKPGRMLPLLAVHFARKVMTVLGWLVLLE